MKKNMVCILVTVLAGCSSGQHETFAHITQRRLNGNGKLVISYQFRNGSQLVYDSMEVPNRIVPHDSVKVVFTANDPAKSHLILP